MTKIISIDGNIGSGKSTFMDHLKKIYKNNDSVHFLKEPVDDWNSIKDENNITILENFYNNQDKYSFSFQMMAYISRLALLKDALKENYKVIITERSVETDKYVFAQMLYDDKKIEKINYEIYVKWFDTFLEDIPDIDYIYIRSDPKKALERVLKRNREGESIPLDYLIKCHMYHDDWMGHIRHKLVIDGNANENSNDYMLNICNIVNYINKFK